MQQIAFYADWRIELETVANDLACQSPNDIVIRNDFSLVSAGTELMMLNGELGPIGDEGLRPGYGSVGTVLEVGPGNSDVAVGDRVFTHGKHATHTLSHVLTLRVPDYISDEQAVMARMAQVALTPIRVARPELGDFVVVQGLGLVGNLTAQLLALNGCRVIGIDVSEPRLHALRDSGVEHLVNARDVDPVEAVEELTSGERATCVVEASGISNLVNTACRMAGKNGAVVLVGSPHNVYTEDGKALLKSVFKWQEGCISILGAHEWRYPAREDQSHHYKHSMERNIKVFWELVRQKKLGVEPLIGEVTHPANAVDIYRSLQSGEHASLGVLFDWRNLK